MRFTTQKPYPARHGFTLAEVMISLALVGLMAAMMVPQVVTQPAKEQNKQITQSVENMMQQLSTAIYNYQQTNAYNDEDLQEYILPSDGSAPTVSYAGIFYYYGNYFSYKQKDSTSPKYFYFLDKSRLAFDPTFFTAENDEAINADIIQECKNGTTANFCVFLDYNGAKTPGEANSSGDVIPLYINPETHTVQTLYEAKSSYGARNNLCSIYDNLKYGCTTP